VDKVETELELRILADRIEQQKEPTDTVTVSIEAA
jgi:hypothetical protein